MNLIQDNAILIIGILLVLIVIEGLIIYVQYKNKPKKKGKNKGGSSSSVSKERYNEVVEKLNVSRSDINQLKAKNNKTEKEYKDLYRKFSQVDEEYTKACLYIANLKSSIDELREQNNKHEEKIRELILDNDKLSKLAGKEPTPIVAETTTPVSASIIPQPVVKEIPVNNVTTKSSQLVAEDVSSAVVEQKQNVSKEEPKAEHSQEDPKMVSSMEEGKTEPANEQPNAEPSKEEPKVEPIREKTMYASFPRSAGSNIYFSDLSENRVDDSYFELKISTISGKASFKPLDFMKIRNYDPAMAAMLTEGVKPNVASTVIGIEPGIAHLEGKDWIIDNLAKIKLA